MKTTRMIAAVAVVLIGLVIGLSSIGLAADTTWTNGAATGMWNNAGNWSSGLPGAAVNTIFDDPTLGDSTVDADFSTSYLKYEKAAGTYTTTINNGITLSPTYMYVGQNAGAGTATVVIDGAGTLSLPNSLFYVAYGAGTNANLTVKTKTDANKPGMQMMAGSGVGIGSLTFDGANGASFAGNKVNATYIYAGMQGTGSISFANTGLTTVTANQLQVGRYGTYSGSIDFGAALTDLNVTNGGYFIVASDGGTGSVTMPANVSLTMGTGSSIYYGNATLDLTGGSFTASSLGQVLVGRSPNDTGKIDLTGVGHFAADNSLTASQIHLGDLGGKSGQLLLGGNGLETLNTTYLVIGGSGNTAACTVDLGADLQNLNIGNNGQLFLAQSGGMPNLVMPNTVNLTVGGTNGYVGVNNTTLDLSGGGTFGAPNLQELGVGTAGPGPSKLDLTNAPLSNTTFTIHQFYVGTGSANATMLLTNTGLKRLDTQYFRIGRGGGNAVLDLGNAFQTLNVANELMIGEGGTAAITMPNTVNVAVGNNAYVRIYRTTFDVSNGSIAFGTTGAVTEFSVGVGAVVNAGTVSGSVANVYIGSGGAGTVTFNGGTLTVTGTLYDHYNAAGMLTLNSARIDAANVNVGSSGHCDTNIAGTSSGITVTGASLTIAAGGHIDLLFDDPSFSPTAANPYWGFRWAGDQVSTLDAMLQGGLYSGDGRITGAVAPGSWLNINDLTVGTYNDAGTDYTFIGFVTSGQLPVPEPAGLGLVGLALLALKKRRS